MGRARARAKSTGAEGCLRARLIGVSFKRGWQGAEGWRGEDARRRDGGRGN